MGDAEIPIAPVAAATGNLSFPVGSLPAGTFYVRLRVDGVDSLLVNATTTPPTFDPTQQVTLP